jgi:hypothetical protein
MVRSQKCSTEGEAIRVVARNIGLSYWTAYRIMKRKVKTISTDVEARIRAAEVRYAEAEVRRLQNRIDQLQRIIDHDAETLGFGPMVSVSCRLADLLDKAEGLGKEIAIIKAETAAVSPKRAR